MRTLLRSRGLTYAVEAGLAGWFLVTLLSQHPQRTFDRLRTYDKIGLVVPNWRFFAPEPAVHDFHVVYRTQDGNGTVSPWKEAFSAEERRARHAVWFPNRRREKAVFDVAIDLLGLIAADDSVQREAPSYRLTANAIRRAVAAAPDAAEVEYFQFMVVLYTGYDPDGVPEYRYVSPREPLVPAPAADAEPAVSA